MRGGVGVGVGVTLMFLVGAGGGDRETTSEADSDTDSEGFDWVGVDALVVDAVGVLMVVEGLMSVRDRVGGRKLVSVISSVRVSMTVVVMVGVCAELLGVYASW